MSDDSDTEREEFHRERAEMDRDEWIDDDGRDCLPVFVTRTGSKYHKRYGGCIEPRFARTEYDLFAAEADGFEPCIDCFGEEVTA